MTKTSKPLFFTIQFILNLSCMVKEIHGGHKILQNFFTIFLNYVLYAHADNETEKRNFHLMDLQHRGCLDIKVN